MKTLYHIEHEYEIDLGLLDDSDLFEELEERGYDVVEEGTKALIEEIYDAKRMEKPYDHLLEKLIDQTIARIL